MRKLPLLLVLLPFALHARTVNVSSYAQLLSACQNALPFDTIVIASGTYTIIGSSRIMVTSRPGPVLVKGATGNPADVIVEGQGQDNTSVQMVFNLEDSPQWTFRDITTRRSYYHGFKFDRASTDCRLLRVVMRDHGESGIKGTSDPSAGVYPDRLLVDSCDIGFTSTNGGTRSVVEGVDGVGVNDWIIRNSRFVNVQKGGNPAYAIFTKGNSSRTIIEGNRFENCFIGASFGGGGTAPQFFRDNDVTYEHRDGIIRNNIIMRCNDAAVYINKGMNCKIYNNTVFECELTIQLRFPESSGYVRNNLVKRSAGNSAEAIVRLRDGATFLANQSNLPASNVDFIAATGTYAQLNLRLSSTSAAVDAGVDVGSDVPMDFEGQTRPGGITYDVGADELGTVPVELLSFSGERIDGVVNLLWLTASESNNFGFVIERSSDGIEFLRAAFVPGRGTTTGTSEYRLQLPTVPGFDGDVWFRLRQIDTDGRETVFIVLHLPSGRRFVPERLSINPNPANDFLTVTYSLDEDGRLMLLDYAGRVLHEYILSSAQGTTRLDISSLPSGTYLLALPGTTVAKTTLQVVR